MSTAYDTGDPSWSSILPTDCDPRLLSPFPSLLFLYLLVKVPCLCSFLDWRLSTGSLWATSPWHKICSMSTSLSQVSRLSPRPRTSFLDVPWPCCTHHVQNCTHKISPKPVFLVYFLDCINLSWNQCVILDLSLCHPFTRWGPRHPPLPTTALPLCRLLTPLTELPPSPAFSLPTHCLMLNFF